MADMENELTSDAGVEAIHVNAVAEYRRGQMPVAESWHVPLVLLLVSRQHRQPAGRNRP